MVPINIHSIKGTDGQIRMPDAGILVGWFSSWSMTKDKGDTYVFRGTFGHVNALLWKQDYRKEITIKLSREKTYTLCQADGGKVTFSENDRTLVMEAVSLCQQDGDSKP